MNRSPYSLATSIMAALCLAILPITAAEPWSTYRGNPQRTGNTDGLPGPRAPKVLWALKAKEHFIAAPVPVGEHLLVGALGGLNQPVFHCLNIDPNATNRIAWSKLAPYLKLPPVSSPALSGNKLVFGDGMHQTDGAVLYCMLAERGLPLWQLSVPGTLVHLEGSPTIADGRVYVGGGNAGVLCVDLNRATLEGKEYDLASMQQLLERRWKELLVKYEADKKKDPDFAVPPNEDQLPKAVPVKLWQQGQDKWHVDAPVAVAGDLVLVASAFLDKEKVGDRALFGLDVKTGSVRWRAPLTINPWGGPTVVGNLALISGSTIGFDPRALKGATGQVVAIDLADGKEKWRKEVPGGVLGCLAVSNGLVIASATDGKIRAFDLTSGMRRWIYEGGAPFFAPVAVATDTIYAGDLKGVVHALGVADGKPKWKLDIGADPAVKAPGMIYGGPVVQGGRLFVATCNLEGPHAQQPTVVVCLGDR